MGYREPDDTKRYPTLGHQHHLLQKERNYEAERAEACQRSELLRTLLNKGIKEGEPLEVLLLEAIECIGLITGDAVFTAQNVARIRDRTGADVVRIGNRKV